MEGPGAEKAGRVRIEKIVYGGLGLAHHEGRALFVPFTAPGDLVEFRIESEKKGCIFAGLVTVVEPSPARIEPACPVFGACGGCHLLHLPYEEEIEIKKQHLLESLERIGKIKTSLGAVVSCPERFGYRNHTQFRIDPEGRPGFAMRESTRIVPFPPEGCLLLSPAMREAIAGLPAGSLPPGGEVRAREDAFGAVHFWGLADRPGPPDLLMRAGGFDYPVAPESFFQVNGLLNDKLQEIVLSMPLRTRRRLLDLYCGTGFFTLPLSRIVTEAIGIERDPAAVRGANAALRLNKVINVNYRKGPAERVLGRIGDIDLVVADPPRSGMPDRVIGRIIRLRPAEIIIVSCEPPTFARDARKLIEAGYMLTRLELVDLFPGTYHIETAALFRRS